MGWWTDHLTRSAHGRGSASATAAAPLPTTVRGWRRHAYDASARIARRIDLDRDRLFLWLPVCFGVGIGAYFAQSTEPTLWTACLMAVAAGLGAWLVRHRALMFPIAAACAVAALGFAAASIRTAVVAAPVLAMDLRAATVSGFIVDITERVRAAARRARLRSSSARGSDAGHPAR
ncbi:MAG: hypothetical protein AAFR55_08145, partial [Pseudomonadota bacterium]